MARFEAHFPCVAAIMCHMNSVSGPSVPVVILRSFVNGPSSRSRRKRSSSTETRYTVADVRPGFPGIERFINVGVRQSFYLYIPVGCVEKCYSSHYLPVEA